jgi:hypothetical protein
VRVFGSRATEPFFERFKNCGLKFQKIKVKLWLLEIMYSTNQKISQLERPSILGSTQKKSLVCKVVNSAKFKPPNSVSFFFHFC